MHYGDDNTYGWERGIKCATRDCENDITFPDLEAYCFECLTEREVRRQQYDELYAKAQKRFQAEKGTAA